MLPVVPQMMSSLVSKWWKGDLDRDLNYSEYEAHDAQCNRDGRLCSIVLYWRNVHEELCQLRDEASYCQQILPERRVPVSLKKLDQSIMRTGGISNCNMVKTLFNIVTERLISTSSRGRESP